jgi:predicted PurR-regulated permease PerM
MNEVKQAPSSPRWSSTTKLVIAISAIVLIAALTFYFRSIVGPLILAFILAFFLQPVGGYLSKILKISWRASVNLIYLVLLIFLIALFTASGIAVAQQAQSLYEFVNRFVSDLPNTIANLSAQTYKLGPFELNLSHYDLASLANQLLNLIRPILGQAGTLVKQIATQTATGVGWGLFVLLISYYLLAESGQIRENLVFINVPGYGEDTRRLARELANIWDAYLRSQLVIMLLVVISYYIVLSILGVHLTLVLALMAGLARFVPYIGPWITWITTALVTFLQTGNHFNLDPLVFTIIVIGICIMMDQVFDYGIVPRLMGQALRVHPASVLIAALIAANLIGLVGLVLAAPVLATLNLVGGYVGRKMFDLEAWPEQEKKPFTPEFPLKRAARRMRSWLQKVKRTH